VINEPLKHSVDCYTWCSPGYRRDSELSV